MLHELAHVARRDGWLGLWQRIAEAVLALHPAAWWVSRQIEVERESACDDWAVEHAGDETFAYGESLIEWVEGRMRATHRWPRESQLVTGFIRSKKQLKRRLRNMTDTKRDHEATPRLLPMLLASAGFCLATLGTAAAWPGAPSPLTTQPSHDEEQVLSADDAPLFRAVKRGDLARVQALVDEGESADQVWPGDGSPLIVAARLGDEDMVQLLLDRGADVDLGVGGDGTPLIAAVQHGHHRVVELLLSHGAAIDAAGEGGDGNPLIAASLAGNPDLARYLVEHGATVDIHITDDDTPLINAAQQGHAEVVSLLLDLGADPNLTGDFDPRLEVVRTPLNQARAGGHDRVAELLLAAGADG